MTTKNIAQLAIAIILSIALVVFTAKGIVPTEVFVGFVSVALTWIFREKEKEKEIARLIDSFKKEK